MTTLGVGDTCSGDWRRGGRDLPWSHQAPEPRFPPCSPVCSRPVRDPARLGQRGLMRVASYPETGERPHRLGAPGRAGIPYARPDLRDFARRRPGCLPFSPNPRTAQQAPTWPRPWRGWWALWTVNSHG